MGCARLIGLFVAVGTLSAATSASAQVMWGSVPVSVDQGPGARIGDGEYGGSVHGAPALSDGGVIYPYSYAVTAPLPARGYVGYGSNDIFPYYGRPYGHAYEKWSWGTLSGGNPLARYYYPPVR